MSADDQGRRFEEARARLLILAAKNRLGAASATGFEEARAHVAEMIRRHELRRKGKGESPGGNSDEAGS